MDKRDAVRGILLIDIGASLAVASWGHYILVMGISHSRTGKS